MFADCAGGARAGQPGTARPEGLGALGDAMALVAEVLEALNREGEVEALRRAEEGFRQGIEAMEQLRSRREHAGLLEFLTQVVPMVSEVGVGCVLVLPAAFALPRDDGSRMYDEAAFLLVLRRDTERLCSLTVCNTGAGLEWHPSRIDAADGSALRNATLRLSEVPRDRLTDSAFWYLLYRELFAPKAASADPGTRGPGCLYGRLLPALNTRPLAANLATAADAKWSARPLGGDTAHGLCALAALEAAVGAWGATPSQAAYAATLWRWTALQICAQQLHAAQQCSASDAALLRLAVRTTAAEASELRRGALPLSAAHAAILQQTAKGVEGRAAEAAAKAAAIVAAAGGAEQGDGAGSAQLVAFDESTARIDGGGAAAGGAAARFYLFDRLLREGGVDAGASAPPPIVLPAELSLVPDRVDSYNDVCNALRHAVQLCELLSHQMEHVANTYCVRVSLIQHLLTQ